MAVAVALDPKGFDCATCPHRHCSEDNPAPFAMWRIDGVGELTVCPKGQITPRSDLYLQLFPHYRAGYLAHAGGVMDQPEPYLQAMSLIQSELSKETQ
ncbi:hypothetical protein KUW19_00225 [Ferrimonas balearica]|uniref:hypothetical protein n=1 Tax=Ferrimonas balearica TaxID=44012 RepID=UPI001C969F8D|nr:hypothetical protein [Ferrimonas balearica]MBY6104907.1 hypothetical protein [Ferrimonas balearica]